MHDKEARFITFPLKRVPVRLWQRFAAKAEADGISRREKLLRLVEAAAREPSGTSTGGSNG